MGTVNITKVAVVGTVVGGRSGAGNCNSTFDTGWNTVPSPCVTDAAFLVGFISRIFCTTRQGGGPLAITLGSIVFEFDQNTPLFSLDGGAAISYNSLPSGFLATDLTINYQLSGGCGNAQADMTVNFYVDDVLIRTLVNSVPGTSFGPSNFTYDLCQGNDLTGTQIIAKRLKLEVVHASAGAGGNNSALAIFLSNTAFVATGNYFIFRQSTIITPTNPIQANDTVDVTSDPLGINPIDFSQLLTAELDWTDSGGTPHTISIPSINWITFTLHFWRFRIPTLTGNPPIVRLVITSTEFSGSVELGRLMTIFFLNATGIYSLSPGKTNDTLYDNDNGGTIDAKFPNPTFKTGFIGG
jgi:hypothetical protein